MSSLSVFALYLVTVAGPVLFWLWFFRKQDRFEPEPRKLLAKAFLWGMGSAVFAVGIYASALSLFTFFPLGFLNADSVFDVSDVSVLILAAAVLFAAGPIEEAVKYLYLKSSVYKRPEFNQIADGVMYGASIALGFSFLENSYYFLSTFLFDENLLVFVGVLRAVGSTLLHVTATGFVGIALARAKFIEGYSFRRVYRTLFLAMLYHGLFNVFLVISPLGVLVSFPAVFVAFVVLLRIMRGGDAQVVWRLVGTRQSER